MDLMFTRYSDPFSFMDSLIDNGSFSTGIDRICELQNEDMAWELYLHKVFDKSFDQFKKDISNTKIQKNILTSTEFNATIEMSKSILKSIDPTSKDGELC